MSTAGLTADDVNELAIKVRAQMLDALFELSGMERKAPREETVENLEKVAPSPIEEVPEEPKAVEQEQIEEPDLTREVTPTATVSESEPSTLDHDSRRSGSGSETGTETEEDEGMVLVDRPNV